jgi:hypothetical protein
MIKTYKSFFKKALLATGHVYKHIVELCQSCPVAWDVVSPVKCRVLLTFSFMAIGINSFYYCQRHVYFHYNAKCMCIWMPLIFVIL